MGAFTLYDVITGNPAEIYVENNNPKHYNWCKTVRIIARDHISRVGYYDMHGSVVADVEYFAVDRNQYLYTEYEFDGFIITNNTYKQLMKNKFFKKFIVNHNLFKAIEVYIKQSKLPTHLTTTVAREGAQEVIIGGEYSVADNEKWKFLDPNLEKKLPAEQRKKKNSPLIKSVIRNKKRIHKLVQRFIKFLRKYNPDD